MSNGRMILNNKLGKMRKHAVAAYFKVLW